jgi:Tfp pilus assembly protein FimV
MPSSLYWSGECLYALGRLEEAERAFQAVVQNFPSSVKVEASAYRISLIGLEYRQRELLKLLTWSHEESLRSVEDFRRREKAYEASIALYQKQISDSKRGAASDQDKTLADLRAQVADLGSQLAASDAKLQAAQAESEALRASLAAAEDSEAKVAEAPAPSTPNAPSQATIDKDTKAAALDAKARALDLLSYYLENIAQTESKDGSK